MFSLFRAEQYKLRHGKALWVCIVLVGGLGLLNVILHAKTEIGLLTFISEIIGLIACALFAGLYVGSEFSNKTILYAITSGGSRTAVLLSKYLTFFIGCIVILAINTLVVDVFYMVMYGGEQIQTELVFPFLFGYALAGILYDLCIVSIPFLITMLFKDTALSTVVSVLAIAGILACSGFLWVDREFSFSIMTNNLSTVLPFSNLLAILIIPLVAVGISGMLFRKADIKQ